MESLQKNEKPRQKNKEESILSDTNTIVSKLNTKPVDFHTQIIDRIDFLIRKNNENISSDEIDNTQQTKIIQTQNSVELRTPLNKKIIKPDFQINQIKKPFQYNHITIPEEFKTELKAEYNPSFRFISTLESTDEFIKSKKPKIQHIEVIDLSTLDVDLDTLQKRIEYVNITQKNNFKIRNKKVDVINIKKLGDNNMSVASASNDQSESESDKKDIYYMKSKNAYEKNEKDNERDNSYIPVDFNDKQKRLKEKEHDDTPKKMNKKEQKKYIKEQKKQQKIEEKNKKIEEKLRKKEEKKAIIDVLKKQAEEKKRLKKQGKQGKSTDKKSDDYVQFIETKTENIPSSKNERKTLESCVDEVLGKDNLHEIQNEDKQEDMIFDKEDRKNFESNLKEAFYNNTIEKNDYNKKEEFLTKPCDEKSDDTELEELKVNDNIKKFRKLQTEDVLVDKDIKETYESNTQEKIAENSIKDIQNAKPQDAIADEELIKVLLIADNLLGNLPENVINNFVKSDEFKLYERVIRKYKNK